MLAEKLGISEHYVWRILHSGLNMSKLREAIDAFRGKRGKVYRTDANQILRDSRAAKRAADDHVDRWLLELLQNSDDARATIVQIRVTKEAVYVADNGMGLKASAVEAISGTDLSDKTTGTIGRKGIGFKAVSCRFPKSPHFHGER